VSLDDITSEEREVYPGTFFIRFYPLTVKRASGYRVVDEAGREYIDLTASWAVAVLGYGDQRVIRAFMDTYTSATAVSLTTFSHRKPLELAKELIKITPGSFKKKVVYGFSGSDANEAAYKLLSARGGHRFRILSFIGSYHGQTIGSCSISGHPALSRIRCQDNSVKVPYPYCYRCPFGESYPGCSLACIDFIEKYVFRSIAPPDTISGVMFEPFQSDGGDIRPPYEFVRELKRICDEYGLWLVSDEVKVGLGRTGRMWGIENFGVVPDAVTIGKPLGSGLPISALVAREEMFSESFSHIFTLSGHPAIAAAALETIRIVVSEKLYERASKLGEYLLQRLQELQSRHRLVGDVRGLGLILGIELVKDPKSKEPARAETAKVVYRLWQLGVLTTYVGLYSNVIELTPPLIIDREALDEAVDKIDRALDDVAKGRVSDSEVSSFTGW